MSIECSIRLFSVDLTLAKRDVSSGLGGGSLAIQFRDG